MKELIGYVRVSTDEQGKSGNGLEAQLTAIKKFAEDNGYKLLEVVTEVASGKLDLDKRPVLNSAIVKAVKQGAFVVVSKLDRISRSVAFITRLMETKAKFIVTQLGEDVDTFMLHIYAAVAQKEREMISARTKESLAIVKKNGVKLGNPTNLAEASVRGGKTMADRADSFADKVKPIIERMRSEGLSLVSIAVELNNMGVRTARGGQWSKTQLSRICARF